MLELRPNCELCDKDLPPEAIDALICSYECTFCDECVQDILQNVCPNCGGGFVPRPIRPKKAWREGVSLKHQKASQRRVQIEHDADELAAFIEKLRHISPERR